MNARSVYEKTSGTELTVNWRTADGKEGHFADVQRVEFIPPQQPVAVAVFIRPLARDIDDSNFEMFLLPIASHTQIAVSSRTVLT